MYKIKKLRKYNYDMYIKTNIKALQSNPKSYHQCLQNILQWNVQLGRNNCIGNNNDLDPSQAYQSKKGSILFGMDAKLETQKEWE